MITDEDKSAFDLFFREFNFLKVLSGIAEAYKDLHDTISNQAWSKVCPEENTQADTRSSTQTDWWQLLNAIAPDENFGAEINVWLGDHKDSGY